MLIQCNNSAEFIKLLGSNYQTFLDAHLEMLLKRTRSCLAKVLRRGFLCWFRRTHTEFSWPLSQDRCSSGNALLLRIWAARGTARSRDAGVRYQTTRTFSCPPQQTKRLRFTVCLWRTRWNSRSTDLMQMSLLFRFLVHVFYLTLVFLGSWWRVSERVCLRCWSAAHRHLSEDPVGLDVGQQTPVRWC